MRIIHFIFTSLMVLPIAAHADERTTLLSTSNIVPFIFGKPPATLIAQNDTGKNQESVAAPSVTEDYVCPMHKNIHGKKGGVCPICGMTLVLAHADPAQAAPVPNTSEQE